MASSKSARRTGGRSKVQAPERRRAHINDPGPAVKSNHEELLPVFVVVVVLVSLGLQLVLVLLGRADSQVFSERLNAVAWAGCGALITLLRRVGIPPRSARKH